MSERDHTKDNEEIDKTKEKKEILFYYESRQNPNGDPGFDNQPRMMPDGRIMVTDVRIKRTMRDYAKKRWDDVKLFVDFSKEGKAIKAIQKATEVIGRIKPNDDIIESLLKLTFDVPLFGALIPIGANGNGRSSKLTGPLQFGIGRSVNQVQLINPLISSHFVGKERTTKTPEGKVKISEQQFATFGRFYSVEYALIKVHGALNPENLGDYLSDNDIKKKFIECENRIFECLWNGTNELVTRSKFPQRSILYLEITYKDSIYNDLPDLIDEAGELKERTSTLGKSPFKFEKLVSTIEQRKNAIDGIRVKGCPEISADIEQLQKDIKPTKEIQIIG